MLVKIQDAPGYMKDSHSKAVVNTDKEALRTYRMRRMRERANDDAINRLNNRIDTLEARLQQVLKRLETNG